MMDEKVSREKLLDAAEMCFDFFVMRNENTDFFKNLKQSMFPKLIRAKERKIYETIKKFEGFLHPLDRKTYIEFVSSVKSRTGFSFLDLTRDAEQKCKSVIDRGVVKNEKEWRLLRAFLEKLELDDDASDARVKVMMLLDTYPGAEGRN